MRPFATFPSGSRDGNFHGRVGDVALVGGLTMRFYVYSPWLRRIVARGLDSFVLSPPGLFRLVVEWPKGE